MSTKFHDNRSGAYYRNGLHHMQQSLLRIQSVKNSIYANNIKDHYFKVFDLKMDACAICRKPRSEHPRAHS